MARGIEGNEIATPRHKPTLVKQASTQSSKQQKSLLGFFRKAGDGSSPASQSTARTTKTQLPTPHASHESVGRSSPTPADLPGKDTNKENEGPDNSSPNSARRNNKNISYAESDDEDEAPVARRSVKRRKIFQSLDAGSDHDFALPDADVEMPDKDDPPSDGEDEDLDTAPTRRRRKTKLASSPPPLPIAESTEEIPAVSTARQWDYDPSNPQAVVTRSNQAHASNGNKKQKAHMSEPDQRYPWLATILDADRHPVDHPDYDPRTLYIPPLAWDKFSPFEKQYWAIKQKFWDTLVFFKKGKFYEMYESDATIGHQLFGFKLTDRVNMRMVGVPESALEIWANQFVAKGYKIARVDQMESALAKDMRERDEKAISKVGKPQKEEKVIRRELACVLTAGTLVDGGMLQDDMATYCAAIKEREIDGLPRFGIAFVDTATGQFQLAEIIDDADMTKFETFVAQIRPGELVLEKGCLSSRAKRILKSNTTLTTIWNNLKPDKEFLGPDKTAMTINGERYFAKGDADTQDTWPEMLTRARDSDLVFSAFGALLWYLSTLKIERDLVSLGNFAWYDPIRKASSLVLDGQSLINLEVFANTFDGGTDGTLFTLLNRCVTAFGKRMLRQWVCHPLADADKINARLDAVDALNADVTITDRFTASLSKLPDLERLISRVHSGRCSAQDFVRVLEGFEQIEYTMTLLAKFGEGDGVVGQLITSMPDLASTLEYWRDAFDRVQAKDDGLMVPARGVEADFDQSRDDVKEIESHLDALLQRSRKKLGSSAVRFTDNGKEIYQLEVPIKVGKVPDTWRQVSATKQVKRYYFEELEELVQSLREAQETHAQIGKQVAGRLYARFDDDYATWLAAVKIIAHLDCLISLAKASASMGEPSCRPVFVNDERTVIELEELRHPTMLTSVSDFIPNSIHLGGSARNVDLLTGANAAGKSTILRMTCIAVILAQIGCHLPCVSARLTPIDRIMSRLGAQDNIFAGHSTFMVELSETKKILSEATPRSLVILDELGRGTSSFDGVAVAQAVMHHVASHIGCVGFFATHYHSLAAEFRHHPEISAKRMAIRVDEEAKRVTFLYRFEPGVAEGSFGMHCASMCGIPKTVIDDAEHAAREWEHTAKLEFRADEDQKAQISLGWLSDVAWALKAADGDDDEDGGCTLRSLDLLRRAITAM